MIIQPDYYDEDVYLNVYMDITRKEYVYVIREINNIFEIEPVCFVIDC